MNVSLCQKEKLNAYKYKSIDDYLELVDCDEVNDLEEDFILQI